MCEHNLFGIDIIVGCFCISVAAGCAYVYVHILYGINIRGGCFVFV